MTHIQFTGAPPGSGKTYSRCAVFLSTEFLPHHRGKVFTNYPIKVDAMVRYVLDHHPKMVEKTLRDRICLIPQDVLNSWEDKTSGPWEYFKAPTEDGVPDPLAGAHIAIDEVHRYVSSQDPKPHLELWKKFLGEIRHRKCTLEVLSQYEMKVAAAVRSEATLKRYIFNSEQRCDPFMGIPMKDWYELRAAWTGEYVSVVFESSEVEFKGKWKEVPEYDRKYELKPEFYELYNSYSNSKALDQETTGSSHYYMDHSKAEVVWWFIRRNVIKILLRILLVCTFFWLCFFGGIRYLMFYLFLAMNTFHGDMSGKPAETKHAAAVTSENKTSEDETDSSKVSADKKVLISDNAKLKKQVEELTKMLSSRSDLVLISGNQVVFRSGQEYTVGDTIFEGTYKGLQIKEISHEKRNILLSSGLRVFMAR